MTRRDLLLASAAAPLAAQQSPDTIAFAQGGSIRHKASPSWFPDAGFGLFLHWGICTIREVELGWGFYGDVGGKKGAWPVENYIAQAKEFNPQSFDADRWMEAAAKAGFRYAAITTRHHDGYSLWPSEFGDFGTKQHMGGRDLVGPFLDACRKHGLKAGIYYSPGDWLFNPAGWPHLGYPLRKSDFKYRRPERTLGLPRYVDDPMPKIQEHFETLYAYVKGQVHELLTRYGKIDLLWWDGYDWPAGTNIHGPEMDAWVRKLQPGIVTNDRYRLWCDHPSLGDFSTEFENAAPTKPPEGAWEQCEAICGNWSYGGPNAVCKPVSYVIDRLVRNRAWGGNYLPDFGPRKDGTLPEVYYQTCAELAAWMKHSGESLDKVVPLPNLTLSSVPTTVRGNVWYLHLLGWERQAVLTGQPRPVKATMLRTGAPATIKYENGRSTITMPIGLRAAEDEVVAVHFA
jgi:alpha-L-fucosidase